MKEYFGYPANGDEPAKVGYRSKGKKPVILALHTISAKHPSFDWGVVNVPTTNLSRSLLLDAFGTERCGNSPNKCRCSNKWVADQTIADFESQIVIPKLTNKEIFKLSQLDICDFVFEAIENAREVELSVDLDIELGSLEIKEPELI